MLDQAYDLRRLALQRGRPTAVRVACRPRLLVVAGGKGGAGTTTTAIRLATALYRAGKRTLLVDADPRGGDAAIRCGITERHTLADLLVGRRSWAEVVETAPSGIQVVAGARWLEQSDNGSAAAVERLLELLDDAGPHADVAVIDLGNTSDRAMQRICRTADAVVMVTTSETAALVSTLAAIRSLAPFYSGQSGAGTADAACLLYLTVNMARTVRDAQTARYRLGWACRRLLGVNLAGGDWSRLPHLNILDTKHQKDSTSRHRWPITCEDYGRAKCC